MVRFRVFVGAPSAADVDADPSDYVWKTIQEPSSPESHSQSFFPYPPATLDAASRRISFLYQNVIFNSISEREPEPEPEPEEVDSQRDDDDEVADRPDGSTCITWVPTPAAYITGASSFLPSSGSFLAETCETQETNSSVEYSDTSSIVRFPHFQFSLHKVTPLSTLYNAARSGRGSRKVNVLLAALEVQGPDTVRVRKGPDAGQEVSILKLVLADDQGVCKLTAWRDVADAWAGFGPSPGLKRGDILYFENLVATWETGGTITLTASPYNKPSTEICYRTMPYSQQDNKLRPDLRLGQSDVAVGKVAALVRWFEDMAGLSGAY